MKQLKTRFMRPEEKEVVQLWLQNTPHFDGRIISYPRLQVLCSHNGEALAYLPIQPVLMLESTAVSKNATELESVQALRDLVKAAELVADGNQLREMYFLGTDTKLAEVAEKHGFEKLPWPIYRMKL